MFRRNISLVLIAAIICACSVGTSSVKAQGLSEAQDSQKVKAKVTLISASEKSRVTIKRRNQLELKGYITQARDADFVATDAKTGALTTVAYDDVEQIKKSKNFRCQPRSLSARASEQQSFR